VVRFCVQVSGSGLSGAAYGEWGVTNGDLPGALRQLADEFDRARSRDR
jgi:hypothetical protein